jgi:tight adherence protein C
MNAILNQVAAAVLYAQAALAQVAEDASEIPLGDRPFWEMLNAWDLVLCVLIFVDVTLLILAVFSQRTVVRLSPEREAAIATGHTDRKTVFESPVIRHLMWFLLNLTHRLAMSRLKDWTRRRLVAAGNPDYYTPEEYLALAVASGFILGLLAGVTFLTLLDNFSFISVVIGMFIGMGLTMFQLYDRSEKRVRIISKRVPYSLDLISLAMGAGATFTEAVQTVVREESVDPFNVELKTMLAEMDLGTTRRKALKNLSDRVPLESLRSIVASVIQAEELGTPLGEVLHQEASLLRLHRSVRAENAAAVASVRILVPSLLILIAVVIAIFGPAIMRIVERGLF